MRDIGRVFVCTLSVVGIAVLLAAFVSAPAVAKCCDLLALDARIKAADCMVLGHIELARDVRRGDVFYLVGLVVDFNTTDHRFIGNATALDNIEPDRAWLLMDDRRRLYDYHPVGLTTRCYYDCDAPHDRVALRDGVDSLASRVIGFAFLALLSAVPALVISAAILSVAALLFIILALRGASACADAGRTLWTRHMTRSYSVFGQSATLADDDNATTTAPTNRVCRFTRSTDQKDTTTAIAIAPLLSTGVKRSVQGGRRLLVCARTWNQQKKRAATCDWKHTNQSRRLIRRMFSGIGLGASATESLGRLSSRDARSRRMTGGTQPPTRQREKGQK
ncbi:ExoD superfamily incomplete domain [Pandoravirus japonicus]|uniref:ExoD superfamily incomplete domain n=1 Tax=Pandoravirus japonicus TaxID=2823154 RepID=A0A811BR45_9VIRU|nr:ExoD superfamily incomplete domain [Pandoravirus japonicus]